MNSVAIKNDAPSSKASCTETKFHSFSEEESSPVSGLAKKHLDGILSAEGQHEVEDLAKPFVLTENEEAEVLAAENLVDNSHSQQSSRAGTFVTPKRIKINHETLSSRDSNQKEDSFSGVSASLGNAVTPASIRGVNTPGMESSPDILTDCTIGDQSNGANGNTQVTHNLCDAPGDLKSAETGKKITTNYAMQGEHEPNERYLSGGINPAKLDEHHESFFLDINAKSSHDKSLNLGPEMCVRQSSPPKAIALMPRKQSPSLAPSSTSPVVPRRLDSTMANKNREHVGATDAPTPVAAAAAATASGLGAELRESTSSAIDDIPPPSHFLAAKISPLRSSSRLKKSESKIRGRDSTPPPPSSATRHEVSYEAVDIITNSCVEFRSHYYSLCTCRQADRPKEIYQTYQMRRFSLPVDFFSPLARLSPTTIVKAIALSCLHLLV